MFSILTIQIIDVSAFYLTFLSVHEYTCVSLSVSLIQSGLLLCLQACGHTGLASGPGQCAEAELTVHLHSASVAGEGSWGHQV